MTSAQPDTPPLTATPSMTAGNLSPERSAVARESEGTTAGAADVPTGPTDAPRDPAERRGRPNDGQPTHGRTTTALDPAGGNGLAVPDPSRGRLGYAEAVVIIAAVTVLAALQRPIPSGLTALAAAVCLLMLPSRPGSALSRIASVLATVSRITGQD